MILFHGFGYQDCSARLSWCPRSRTMDLIASVHDRRQGPIVEASALYFDPLKDIFEDILLDSLEVNIRKL